MSTQAEQPGGARGACAACGSEARRARARYCSTCGRALGQDYFPTESLRASYGFARSPSPGAEARAAGAPPSLRLAPRPRPAFAPPPPRPYRAGVPPRPRAANGAASTALAFATYALVPYIGILFCPGALVAGGFGLLRSYRTPDAGGRRSSATGLALGLLILCAQLLLWWILYKVPEWTSTPGF